MRGDLVHEGIMNTTHNVSATLALVLATLTAAATEPLAPRAHAQDAERRAARADGPPLLAELERAFGAAADRIAASVVTLVVERDASAAPARPAEPAEGAELPYNKRPGGDVSGVAIAANRVLTSAYNVEGAKSIIVVDPASGKRLAARVLGRDEALDLALLAVPGVKADGDELTAAAFPERAAPRVGSWLVLVGRGPDGDLGVNSGIVSALGRFRGDALQTDAALNYGNYGGAAVDVEGRLVGMAVRLSTRPGVNSGVGFVIPAERIRAALPLLEKGQTRAAPPRAFLGVQFGREILEPPGVEIARVVDGSSAHLAGIEKGDVIRRVADADASDAGSVADAIQEKRPGDVIRVEVDREGKRLGFEVTLGVRPQEAR